MMGLMPELDSSSHCEMGMATLASRWSWWRVKEAESMAVRVLDYLADATDQPRHAVTPEAS